MELKPNENELRNPYNNIQRKLQRFNTFSTEIMQTGLIMGTDFNRRAWGGKKLFAEPALRLPHLSSNNLNLPVFNPKLIIRRVSAGQETGHAQDLRGRG